MVVKETINQQKWKWQAAGTKMTEEFAQRRNMAIAALNVARKMDKKKLVKCIHICGHLQEKIDAGYSTTITGEKDTIISSPLTYANLIRSNDLDKIIIEYNEKRDDNGNLYSVRILIRDNKARPVKYKNSAHGNNFTEEWVEGNAQLCTSIELINLLRKKPNPEITIITTYYNLKNDKHKTLNNTRYNK